MQNKIIVSAQFDVEKSFNLCILHRTYRQL